jgi:cyclophilin family peptidyl-prolyl cis-trans isomerase
MKKFLVTAAVLAAGIAISRADDVALVTLAVGKEKTPEQFAMEFHEADAPRTVENFKKLVDRKFYNGLAIHRAFPHILVQMGDPLSRRKDRTKVGTGGPGYTVLPEIHRKHTKGAIAAARLPDKINPARLSNGSQFYICLAPIPSYDGQYTVFGNILWGLDTLDALSTKPVDSNDYPVERIVIKSIKIMPREELPPQPAPVKPGPAPKKPWWKFF